MAEAVFLQGVSRSFGSQVVLQGLDFSLEEGGFTCILGKSGCGKSTLLRIITGLEKAQEGEVRAESRVAVAFQEPRLVPWLRVEKNVRMGLTGFSREEAKAASREALRGVGLEGKARAWPLSLSGGEAQRVSLARALVRRPRLLLLDEPFSGLDAFTRREMQDLLAALVKEYELSAVMVTHDAGEARRLADRALVLEGGKLREM